MINCFSIKSSLFYLFKQRCTLLTAFGRNVCVVGENQSFQTDNKKESLILGIETSCDDTGAAIVDSKGNVLGEALHSQLQTHLDMGGIIPPIARDLHAKNIARIVETALQNAQIEINALTAIAATVKPGMPLSLLVGMNFAKKLCKEWNKPLIPIHHMEAHALTARMVEKVDFPFLVLLASGGHCLLAVAKNVDEFVLLGESIDNAPGEVLDKAARRLKLKLIPGLSSVSGGKAIEELAKQGDPRSFEFGRPMHQHKDCSFSYSGLHTKMLRHIEREELKHNTDPDQIIPSAADLCASFQHAIFALMCRRVQRAMLYIDIKKIIPEGARKLVVSGGVASNRHFRRYLNVVCAQMDYTLICPPPNLCTDNGIMIAWNGMEKWLAGTGIVNGEDIDAVDIEPKAKFGTDMSEDVRNSQLSVKWVKLLRNLSTQSEVSVQEEQNA